MRFKNNKSNNNRRSFSNNKKHGVETASKKFLYQKQENRKRNLKSEEELYSSQSDQDNHILNNDQKDKDISEGYESEENIANNNRETGSSEGEKSDEVEESEASEHSDSDSEDIIYKEDNEDDIADSKINSREEVKLSLDEKEKINNIFLEQIENCKDLKKKIEYATTFIKNENNETKFGLSFLDSKNGLMIMYETYLILYTMMRSSGIKIENKLDFNEDDNLMKNLISCRTFLEKIKTIDMKLKSQIERFMKLSEQHDNDEDETAKQDENDKEKDEEEEENATAMRVRFFTNIITYINFKCKIEKII